MHQFILKSQLVMSPCDCTATSCPPQIRDSIKALFPDRDCYTLVRPMHDERALNHLDALEPSMLRPEFSEVTGGHLEGRFISVHLLVFGRGRAGLTGAHVMDAGCTRTLAYSLHFCKARCPS